MGVIFFSFFIGSESVNWFEFTEKVLWVLHKPRLDIAGFPPMFDSKIHY